MSLRLLFQAVLAVVVVATTSVSGANASYAADDELISKLVLLNPGITAEELIANAERAAKTLDTTPEAVLERVLREAQESADNTSRRNSSARTYPLSGGGGGVTLGNAAHVGDVFYSPNKTFNIPHGHTGIYYTHSRVVEAPGLNKTSRATFAFNVNVVSGTGKFSVDTNQTNRNAAASYAYDNMRDKPYNANFAFNHVVPASKYNCSQLVWGAYKESVNIDLDGDGGFGVYPIDIAISSQTTAYAVVT